MKTPRAPWLPLLLGAAGSLLPSGLALAIHNGPTVDTPRAAVYIQLPGGAMCSGTLISPSWVLTANHCTTGRTVPCYPDIGGLEDIEIDQADVNDPFGKFFVGIPPAGSSDPEHDDTQWFNVNQIVSMGNPTGPLDVCNDEQAARDVALVHLTRRVLPMDVEPIHPPILDGNTCPDSFNGAQIGYGPNGWDGMGDDDPNRRQQIHDWARHANDGGTEYFMRHWSLFPSYTWDLDSLGLSGASLPEYILGTGLATAILLDYGGMMGGDSGGPLLYEEDGDYDDVDDVALCGVASKTWLDQEFDADAICLTLPTPSPACWVTRLRNHYIATDDPEVKAFLKDNILVDGHFECESGVDSDNDGIDDECDNCPTAANPNQKDSDKDGYGDACDICPGFDDDIDGDGDGVPYGCDKCRFDGNLPKTFGKTDTSNGDWDGDGVCNGEDNCVYAKNPGQRNTNSFVEKVRGAAVRGDACEAVPVPDVWLEEGTEQAHPQNNLGAHWYINDTFSVHPLASRGDTATGYPEDKVNVPDVATEFRFCQSNPGMDCTASKNVSDLHLEDGITAAQETKDMPWHRITLDGMAAPGETRIYDYMSLYLHQERWLYVQDAARFTTDDLIDVPAPTDSTVTAGEGLGGYLWTHARTSAGGSVDVGTGLHAKGLANYYTDYDPEFMRYKQPFAPIVLDRPRYFELFIPKGDPQWHDRFGGEIFTHHGIEVMVESSRGFGLLDADGQVVDGSAWMTEGARKLLSEGTAVVGAQDMPAMGGLQALILSARGDQVMGALTRQAGAVGSTEDEAAPKLGIVDQMIPGAAEGAMLAFSPRLGSVYSLTPSGELYRGDLELGAYAPIAEGLTGARALVADAASDTLYVVTADERQTRLVAVDAFIGEPITVATIAAGLPRETVLDLGILGDDLLISITDARGAGHAVLSFDLAEGRTPTLLTQGEGALVLAPLAVEEGFILASAPEGRLRLGLISAGASMAALRSWDDVATLF